jgi:ferric-dicitrate binding protein FerR (iron transport regulator)
MKTHKQYLVEDFVLDDSFRNWVLKQDPEEDAYWEAWLDRHPEYWHVLEEAREMVRGLQHQPAEVSQEEIEEGFLEIADHFDQTVQNEALWSKSFLIKIAAAVLLLVAAGLGVLYQNQSNQQLTEYITHYGENKKVELPDGSRVYMKGNTRLSYFPDWEKRRERKVNLKGEAYFQVKEQFYQGRKT